ncbi:hypothetical protein Vafri_8332 [Volvox africanus]|nr:hypothetical protein Vafri_8332 [Volvox africanus]
MSSDSEDDAPLIRRANTKGAASAPAIKQEHNATKKPVAIKAEVKVEVKEEDTTGAKGPQVKELQNEAKAKGREKKTPVAKGKAGTKGEDAALNGKAAAAPKKVKEEGKQPREKKEYDMPGQTREPPPETDSLRKFYTSLLEQRPESELAKKWCLTHGLLPREEAEDLVAQLKKSKPAIKSPAKPSARSESKSAAAKPRRPTEKAPAPKRQRQAVPPPKKSRAKYSDVEDESSSDSDEDDDDEPIVKAKPATKPAAKAPAAKSTPASSGHKRSRSQDRAFIDGGLEHSDDEDDLPLVKRAKK